MKAFLFYLDNGLDYEDYNDWVEKVFLVPNDFSELTFRQEFISHAKEGNLLKFDKNGFLNRQFRGDKFDKAYLEYFSRKFKEIEIYKD